MRAGLSLWPSALSGVEASDLGQGTRALGHTGTRALGRIGSDMEWERFCDALGRPAWTRDPRFAQLNADGSEMPDPPQWILAKGKVRFVGEPVAFVVAETQAQARDAAERVEIDYDPLPVVTTAAEALAPGAPRLWDTNRFWCGSDLCWRERSIWV